MRDINSRKPDPGECMVIGCVRRALYRSNGTHSTKRGYCREHKDHATDVYRGRDIDVERFITRTKWRHA